MMTVSLVIMGALMPTLTATVADAKRTRVLADEQNLATQMNDMLNDVNDNVFTFDGSGSSASKVSLLVSDGDLPRECTAPSGCGGGATSWDRPVDNTGGLVDFIERHLSTNNPRGNPANDYPITGADHWRGAYWSGPVDPDPWGNRYMVNAHWLNSGTSNVIVLSAGPNEIIECIFTNAGYTLPSCGGDDIGTLVEN